MGALGRIGGEHEAIAGAQALVGGDGGEYVTGVSFRVRVPEPAALSSRPEPVESVPRLRG